MRLLLGADTGKVSHVGNVDGKEFGEQRPAPITNNVPHRVLIRVRHNEGKASFNIDWDSLRDYIKWEGNHTALANHDGSFWKITMIRHPWIGGWNNQVVFQTVRVRMLSGTIRRDSITDADRDQDLKNGYVRLVGEKANNVSVGTWRFVVNQVPLELAGRDTECRWPLVVRDLKIFTAPTLHRVSSAPYPLGPGAFRSLAMTTPAGWKNTRF
jgi:hypothetical protein